MKHLLLLIAILVCFPLYAQKPEETNRSMTDNVIVESGGHLIIDGGTLSNVELDLKPGSTLRIVNDGIIETRDSFTAPIGAIVEVEYGQIM